MSPAGTSTLAVRLEIEAERRRRSVDFELSAVTAWKSSRSSQPRAIRRDE
jgi:hypothetical protein